MRHRTSRVAPPALPEHLAARAERIGGADGGGGRYVLCWLHHALRDHDNPALDLALTLAAGHGLPVLVYAGLHGRHPYASDRHHRFILESLAELQPALEDRGLTVLVSVPLGPGERSPLDRLAGEAAAVVTETFPVPPFRRWTARLARRAPCPVWTVDARCLVPMPVSTRRPERAYRFRKETAALFEAALTEPWPEPPPSAGPVVPPTGVSGVNLAAADPGELVARADIDHAVGPVPHTPGGMRAGAARWRAFLEHGLDTYHRLRNDAAIEPPRGVSRLSPYLHYGCVSVWRIAREAHRRGGPGAAKFLDELWVWRELAHHWCHRTADPETLEALPAWARETLAAHADDPRERVLDLETLARGRTGEPLWDAAQQSLLRHGELHNNLRMTWGKAIVDWSQDPATALARLVALNHRYALDGSDPSSYGGLLWCLGLFDRPFEPPRPVTGRLRRRPVAAHAGRLDLNRYARRVGRPATGGRLGIAVIGAGAAGAVAARTLADHGHAVALFDKGRGPGGRLSTRRAAGTAFDHGAPGFRLDDPRLAWWRDAWQARGLVQRWGADDDHGWTAVPAMNALVRHLLADVPVAWSTRVDAVTRIDGRWALAAEPAVDTRFDVVLVAVPAPQAPPLLAPAPALAAAADGVRMAPAWTALCRLAAGTGPERPWLRADAGPLGLAIRNDAKPGRPAGPAWVLHASPAFARDRLEDEPEEVARTLYAAFADAAGLGRAAPVHLAAHRWRHALTDRPLGESCLWAGTLGIGACGDWCLGDDVESALLSGTALAGRVLNTAARRTEHP